MATTYTSLEETANEHGIQTQHLRRMIHNGVLPAGTWTRLGRRFFIHRIRFDEFLEQGGASLPGGWRQEDPEAAA